MTILFWRPQRFLGFRGGARDTILSLSFFLEILTKWSMRKKKGHEMNATSPKRRSRQIVLSPDTFLVFISYSFFFFLFEINRNLIGQYNEKKKKNLVCLVLWNSFLLSWNLTTGSRAVKDLNGRDTLIFFARPLKEEELQRRVLERTVVLF